MSAANTRFQHAAAPDRDTRTMGYIVNSNGFTKTAYASNFDVNNFACTQLDGRLRVPPAMDRLIKTYIGLQLFLQPGMKIKIVRPEWLFDHQQVESIKLFQVIDLVQRVGGGGDAAEHDLRPARAYFGEDLHVPPWLTLDLDAAIAGIQFGLNFHQQLLV